MTDTTTSGPLLQISLIGGWQAFDPADPLPGDQFVDVRKQLGATGLLGHYQAPANATLALAATLAEWPDEIGPDSPPVFASLLMHQHTGSVKVDFTDDGDIVPQRRVRRFSADWPADDVGQVQFHQVSYLIPLPESPVFYTLLFTSPNIPLADELEFLYDTIVSTIEWINPMTEPDASAHAGPSAAT